nr:apoptosis regulator E10 [Equid gammaherpesvirus 5]UTK45556.1 apoptosis regulator E10 [Equid gammaherpesvirus 5]
MAEGDDPEMPSLGEEELEELKKDALENLRVYLCEKIIAERHFDYLRQSGHLGREDVEDICHKPTSGQRCSLLLDFLSRQPTGYDALRESCARTPGQQHIAVKLEQCYNRQCGDKLVKKWWDTGACGRNYEGRLHRRRHHHHHHPGHQDIVEESGGEGHSGGRGSSCSGGQSSGRESHHSSGTEGHGWGSSLRSGHSSSHRGAGGYSGRGGKYRHHPGGNEGEGAWGGSNLGSGYYSPSHRGGGCGGRGGGKYRHPPGGGDRREAWDGSSLKSECCFSLPPPPPRLVKQGFGFHPPSCSGSDTGSNNSPSSLHSQPPYRPQNGGYGCPCCGYPGFAPRGRWGRGGRGGRGGRRGRGRKPTGYGHWGSGPRDVGGGYSEENLSARLRLPSYLDESSKGNSSSLDCPPDQGEPGEEDLCSQGHPPTPTQSQEPDLGAENTAGQLENGDGGEEGGGGDGDEHGHGGGSATPPCSVAYKGLCWLLSALSCLVLQPSCCCCSYHLALKVKKF